MRNFLFFLLMLSCTNTFAAINKWIDDQGKVHYSDQPPAGDVKTEKLRSATDIEGAADTSDVSAPGEHAAPKTFVEKAAELKKAQQAKKEADAKAATIQANEEAKKTNCTTSQQNLKILQNDIPLVEIDAKGERSYMDDNQRQQRVLRAQHDVDTYCK